VKKLNDFEFDNAILEFIRVGIRKSIFSRLSFPFLARTWFNQMQSMKTRKKIEKKEIHVPPILILSITRKCNLHCSGCYARVIRPDSDGEMNKDKLLSLLKEALNSNLMKEIRNHHNELTETSGGCALWNKKDWLAQLQKESNK